MIKIITIGIPTINEGGLLSDVSMHFGRTPYLTIVKIENDEMKDIDTIEIQGKHMVVLKHLQRLYQTLERIFSYVEI